MQIPTSSTALAGSEEGYIAQTPAADRILTWELEAKKKHCKSQRCHQLHTGSAQPSTQMLKCSASPNGQAASSAATSNRGPESGPSAEPPTDDKNGTQQIKIYKTLINSGERRCFSPISPDLKQPLMANNCRNRIPRNMEEMSNWEIQELRGTNTYQNLGSIQHIQKQLLMNRGISQMHYICLRTTKIQRSTTYNRRYTLFPV